MIKKRFVSYLLLTLILVIVTGIGLLQTPFFKTVLTQKIIEKAKDHGMELEMQTIQGIMPLKWICKKAKISWKDGSFLESENLKIRISLLSLFKKKLSIRFLSFEKLHYGFIEANHPYSLDLDENPLPFDLLARTVKCKELILENISSHQLLQLSLQGKIRLYQNLKEAHLSLTINELFSQNKMSIDLISSQKKNLLDGTVFLKLVESQNLSSFLQIPLHPSLDLSATALGKWSFWQKKDPLSVHFSSQIESLHLSNFESSFNIESKGLFYSDLSFSCSSFEIQNNWMTLFTSFDFSPQKAPLTASLSCFITDLSKIPSPLPLKGEMEAKASLSLDTLSLSITSSKIKIGEQSYLPSSFSLLSHKKGTSWEGTIHGNLNNQTLSLIESCSFSFEDKEIKVHDLSILCGGATLGGTGFFNLETNSYAGSFYVEAKDLRPFRALAPLSELDGKLGGFLSFQGSFEDLSLQTDLLLKNIRYQNNLVNTARIEMNLEKLLTHPSGTFLCELENLFFKDLFLSKLQISSTSLDQKQSFSAQIQGDWKQKLLLDTTGTFKKQGQDLEISFDTCQGSFLGKSFALQNPFTLEKKNHELFLDPCLWTIGEGSFFGRLHANAGSLSLEAKAENLPLEIFSTFYPQITFKGNLSFQTSLSDSGQGIEGNFLATLKQANLSETSIQAKGSLQAHFQGGSVQVQTHLYAINNQFLDLTTTLPFSYSCFPFSFDLNKTKPVAGELRMQGAIEEIFDFMNTASHKSSGWITAHLFLAKNLQAPSLQGSLDLQNGSYENYFSGTNLRQIEGEIRASGTSLHLLNFKAHDEQEGELKASGSLLLKDRFPFDVKALIVNMHLLNSNPIKGSFSGEATIQGDLDATLLEGSFEVKKVEIQLLDELATEIPVLPITYINQPIHLKAPLFITKAPYPIHLNLHLNAEDKVFLLGKGLDSEWGGPVQLSGTLDHMTAKGLLSLKKGTFVFSGKTFTLKQGEISFLDKPILNAYLKISGELPLTHATIVAQMQGPLESPKLTFQSIPFLPTSSILSLILFNKDISEISALQALQLAHTFVTLSGNGGPNVLETIRKSIGVDRLNIVGKDGTDEISLQIGWYLTHGVTLSLSQSATSSDVTVEVDLKNGFIFQAETQNQEEGKFSLKWNKNY